MGPGHIANLCVLFMLKLQTSWGALAYSDTQSAGLPLMFLHGSGCDSRDWQPVFKAFTSEGRRIALDFRGHGESSVPGKSFTVNDLASDVLALADRLKIQRLVIAGHSLGGMVAMAVAQQSARVAGLVLLEGWTRLGAGAILGQDRFYGKLAPAAIDWIRQKRQATQQRFRPDIWGGFWDSVGALNMYGFLKNASIPIVEAYGDIDRKRATPADLQVPPNPHIEWVWIPDAGHYLPHEKPAAVANLCEAMVRKISS